MSLVSNIKSTDLKSSSIRLSSESIRSKNSKKSESFISEHGSKFGKSVSKFPKKNDPGLVQTVSIVNSRVIPTLLNFPVKINLKFPDLTCKEATDCIRELGSFLNILDYEFNYTSFWLLDILSKLIKHMQPKGLSIANQNICLAWFRFVLRTISVSGDTREEIFHLLQKLFLKAEESIKSGSSLPQPEEIDIAHAELTKLSSDSKGRLHSSKSLHSVSSRHSRKSRLSQTSSKSIRRSSLASHTSNRSSRSSKSLKSNAKTSSGENVELNLQVLYSIIEMIYIVFADRFMFSLISQTYSSPTIMGPAEVHIDFKDPKLIRPTLVITPPPSPGSKKTSVSKPGKKGKDKGKGKKKESPASGDLPAEAENKAKNIDKNAKSKKNKSKGSKEIGDESPKKDTEKGGKAKKRSKPSLGSDHKEKEKSDSKNKGKEKRGKNKNKSKSSEDTKITEGVKEDTDAGAIKTFTKSNSEELQNINKHLLEEKLKLFDKKIDPEIKLKMKKIEVKDKYILPLSEGVRKDYVDNLIKSLSPMETKQMDNQDASKTKSEEKLRKGSSLKGKKKGSKTGKKAKGKKK